jgi:uncharacterized protein YndB with AHSA1/START domain
MLASIEKIGDGYTARFDRHWPQPVEQVWSWLTENDKLSQWFSELRVDDLREGGRILFDMQDGTFETMDITELSIHSVLEYTWGGDLVRFELYPELGGCHLVLVEKLTKLTAHTPKDLAGWHVCLEVVKALLEGKTLESRDSAWKHWYEEYVRLLELSSKAD